MCPIPPRVFNIFVSAEMVMELLGKFWKSAYLICIDRKSVV